MWMYEWWTEHGIIMMTNTHIQTLTHANTNTNTNINSNTEWFNQRFFGGFASFGTLATDECDGGTNDLRTLHCTIRHFVYIYLYVGIFVCVGIGDAVLVVVCSKYFRCFCVAESMMMYLLWYGPNVFLLVVSTTLVMPLPSTCLSTDCKVTNVSHRRCACQQIETAQRFKETMKITSKTSYQAPMNLVAIILFYIYFQWKCEVFLFSVSKMIYDFVCICWRKRISPACIWCFFIDWEQGAYASFESK